jgi:Spy/CpxP family protein refolding chaperone
MNINKKLITAAAIMAFSGSLALAQSQPQPHNGGFGHGRRQMNFGRLAHKLNLTADQKQQFRESLKSFREENRAFFESFRQNRQDLHAAKEAGDTAKADALKATIESQRQQALTLRKAQMEKFEAVLTPEQRTQLEAMREKHRERRQ